MGSGERSIQTYSARISSAIQSKVAHGCEGIYDGVTALNVHQRYMSNARLHRQKPKREQSLRVILQPLSLGRSCHRFSRLKSNQRMRMQAGCTSCVARLWMMMFTRLVGPLTLQEQEPKNFLRQQACL